MSISQSEQCNEHQGIASLHIQETLPILPSVAPQAHIEFTKEGSFLAIFFIAYLIVRETRIILQIIFFCKRRFNQR